MPETFTDQEWTQILEITRAALELPSTQRLAFIQGKIKDGRLLREAIKITDELEEPEPDDSSRLSTSVGRFLLLDYLGAGAFGEVYSAHDPDLLRTVAVKILKPDAYAFPGHEERFV